MPVPIYIGDETKWAMLVLLPQGVLAPSLRALIQRAQDEKSQKMEYLAITTLDHDVSHMCDHDIFVLVDQKIVQGDQGTAGLTFFPIYACNNDNQCYSVRKTAFGAGICQVHPHSRVSLF